MRDNKFPLQWKHMALAAVCASMLAFGASAHADDDDDDDDRRRRGAHHGYYDHHRDGHHYRDRHRRHEHRRHREHRRHGWHYSRGRHWAPPHYRGRYCDDRRHHRHVHYHVPVSDYYDYYYPRYSYHGPRPHGAHASVIISLPLF